MKLKVPFVKNIKKWKGKGWCGPIALASLLRYYKNKNSERISWMYRKCPCDYERIRD